MGLRSLAILLLSSAFLAGMVLGPARWITGSWDWPRGWLVIALYVAESTFGSLFFLVTDPGLVRERSSVRVQSSADARATLLVGVVFVAWFLAATTDVHLGPLLPAPAPPVSLGAGLAIHVLGFAVLWWTGRVNSFAATVVKVQPGQRVIDTGPYAIVRHPMYLGSILWLAGLALVLDSTATALLTLPVFVLAFWPRMVLEEATLRRELPGYAEYLTRVRARLLPGLL